jgi:hypothetical protein
MAHKTLEHTIQLLMSIDETFDVGVDTRSGVDDSYSCRTASPAQLTAGGAGSAALVFDAV